MRPQYAALPATPPAMCAMTHATAAATRPTALDLATPTAPDRILTTTIPLTTLCHATVLPRAITTALLAYPAAAQGPTTTVLLAA